MSLEHLMGFGVRERRRGLSIAVVAALALHGALAITLRAEHARAAPPPPPTELELEEAPEPEPPPPEPEPEPAPEEAPKIAAPAAAAPAPKAAAPAAAKAAPLLTANDDPKSAKDDEPVSFVSDPNGTTYGSGVVAKGGTADVGANGAKAGGVTSGTGNSTTPTAKALATGEALVPASDLSRAPSLPGADVCKGFFPASADDDVATVSLVVVVKPSGDVASASIASEAPKAQGFGQAARSCLLTKRFIPALDQSGKAVSTATKVTVRFSR